MIDSVQDDKQASWLYTRDDRTGKLMAARAVTLSVLRQPGTNTIEVTDRVRALLPLFRSELPPSLDLLVRGDRSISIRRAFHDVQITMLITLVLVVAVIFLFLRNRFGHDHPQPGAAVHHPGDVRGDGLARISAWTTCR